MQIRRFKVRILPTADATSWQPCNELLLSQWLFSCQGIGTSNKIKTNYFIVCLKVDQRTGQLSLPHLGITKTEKIELKHKTD